MHGVCARKVETHSTARHRQVPTVTDSEATGRTYQRSISAADDISSNAARSVVETTLKEAAANAAAK